MMIRTNAKKAEYILVRICGKDMLFTDERLDSKTIPSGWHLYEVRHADERQFLPAEISEHIYVNFFGSLLSIDPIDSFDSEVNGRCFKYIESDGYSPNEDSWDYVSFNSITLTEYVNSKAA